MSAVEIPVPTLSGEFDAHIHDGSGTPTNVIPREIPWSVHCRWYLKGALAPILTGDWHLRVSLESMGDGPEGTSSAVVRDYQTTGTLVGTFPNQEMRFDATVNFPPGTPTIGGQDSRAYRGTALLTFRYDNGAPGPFAAVYDLGVIQFFDSPAAP
jgi:hypothetical protein